MDLLESLEARTSIRGYKTTPVPKEKLVRLLEIARHSPSWANTQPWEIAVIGGQPLVDLKRGLEQKVAGNAPSIPDIPWPTLPDKYMDRQRENGKLVFATLGIAREDREKRVQWNLKMARFFDAPNGLIIYIDKGLSNWSLIDVGLVMQTVALGAHGLGLGTCMMAAVVRYPEVLREVLRIPQSKLIVCGMSLGYPDESAPINRMKGAREPVEGFVTWHGV